MAQVVTIPYKPRHWATILHDAVARWIVLVLHRRAGKTTAVINHLQRDALRIPESQYAYIAPTQIQARRIAWDIAKRASRPIPNVKTNESLLCIEYPNGSKLWFLGSENIDSLRGMALWGGAQDESAQQPSNLFSEVISKCLADHLGYWIWLGTPKGHGEFFRTYKIALAHPKEWACLLQTIDETLESEDGETITNLRQALEDDKKLVAQGLMTQEEFDQEWYCSFDAAIRGAIYGREVVAARKEGRIGAFPWRKDLLVHTVLDIGNDDRMALGFYQKPLGMPLCMIDYYEGSQGEALPQLVKVLQEKPYNYGKHFAPHDIRQKDWSTNRTRIETARNLGITYSIVPNVSVEDGINAGRLSLSGMVINEGPCTLWLDYIALYRREYKEKHGVFSDTPLHDYTSHAADVHRYAALCERQMTNEPATPTSANFHDQTKELWDA